MDKENFTADVINVNWKKLFELDRSDPNFSFE